MRKPNAHVIYMTIILLMLVGGLIYSGKLYTSNNSGILSLHLMYDDSEIRAKIKEAIQGD